MVESIGAKLAALKILLFHPSHEWMLQVVSTAVMAGNYTF